MKKMMIMQKNQLLAHKTRETCKRGRAKKMPPLSPMTVKNWKSQNLPMKGRRYPSKKKRADRFITVAAILCCEQLSQRFSAASRIKRSLYSSGDDLSVVCADAVAVAPADAYHLAAADAPTAAAAIVVGDSATVPAAAPTAAAAIVVGDPATVPAAAAANAAPVAAHVAGGGLYAQLITTAAHLSAYAATIAPADAVPLATAAAAALANPAAATLLPANPASAAAAAAAANANAGGGSACKFIFNIW
ncbi:antifreeze protein Maxi-like [Zingiber officinale]|uniref:antifreeze protein Maxi-like n=1 Tax=Zingiber officinale TaxID=94328 RepID=UPI001C4C6777|nr:antifreeze protein Maxi-like [Zingiber officinale]